MIPATQGIDYDSCRLNLLIIVLILIDDASREYDPSNTQGNGYNCERPHHKSKANRHSPSLLVHLLLLILPAVGAAARIVLSGVPWRHDGRLPEAHHLLRVLRCHFDRLTIDSLAVRRACLDRLRSLRSCNSRCHDSLAGSGERRVPMLSSD